MRPNSDKTDKAVNRRNGGWEAQEDYLEFLSGVETLVNDTGEELGADFRFEISPPESIDGDESAPHSLSFFICLRKSGFPANSYCLYARLEPRGLRAFAGTYENGKVKTKRELKALDDLGSARKALDGWLHELFWLSLADMTENA